jgi:hypothetical protein
MFTTWDQVEEGARAVFPGLFIQYSGDARLEPTVGTGALCAIPQQAIPTTLGKSGNVYLAQAEAYSGNSGSPMFANTLKTENSEPLLVLWGPQRTSAGKWRSRTPSHSRQNANSSGVSVVAPADEVKKLLFSPALERARDMSLAQRAAK